MDGEIRVGLIGCGVIGRGVVALLRDHADLIARRAGAAVRLTVVADKDKKRLEAAKNSGAALLEDAFEAVTRDDVDIVVELIGGVDVAERIVRAACQPAECVLSGFASCSRTWKTSTSARYWMPWKTVAHTKAWK